MDYTAILIIPTGIGAAIGGYAGDGMPVARAMAQICDRVITHPNVLNGAQLYWPSPQLFYVEGYGLDQFAQGTWGLQPVHQNRVGLILDQGIEPELKLRHIQAAEATKATLGINIDEYVVTDTPLTVELRIADSGASWGTIQNPDSLLRAAEKLIQRGVNAVAVVVRFPDEEGEWLDNYRQGSGVDALAGAEAVISHLIVRQFKIPAAHAPALSPLPVDPSVSPRTAAEELGYTFLPCVLVGLSRAPQFITDREILGGIWSNQVDALVIPASACGGSTMLSFANHKAIIIAVEENQTMMQVFPEMLGIEAIRVKSYLEALGVMVAHRAGIAPSSLQAHVSSLKIL
ncbi:MAG: DUF3326 domain-containing protein [Microcystaceae cyanobacterium]